MVSFSLKKKVTQKFNIGGIRSSSSGDKVWVRTERRDEE
jgi:hypothetical protein